MTAGNLEKTSSTEEDAKDADGARRPQRPPTNLAGRALTWTEAGKEPEAGRSKRRRGTSMTRLLAQKKSVPKIGFCTSATRKWCTTLRPGNEREIGLDPKVRMEEPFAAVRRAEAGDLF